jgi:hypothetical protein
MNDDPCALYEAFKLLGVEPPLAVLLHGMPSLGDEPQPEPPRLIDLAPNPPAHLIEEAHEPASMPQVIPDSVTNNDLLILHNLQTYAWEVIYQAIASTGKDVAEQPKLALDPAFACRLDNVAKAKLLILGGPPAFFEGIGAVRTPPLPATRCRCRAIDKKRRERK